MKKYCCQHCGRTLFEGKFTGLIIVICRRCKTKNIFEIK